VNFLECCRTEIEKVKGNIRYWMDSGFPREFLEFFFKWALLNLYYSKISNQKCEVYKVLDFGKKYEALFDCVKAHAFKLVNDDCVGRGLEAAPPSRWVKTATLQLREKLGINTADVCANCRSEKQQKCKGITTVKHDFGRMEALMRILYQIRCNLFHGGKTEWGRGQMERNQSLVRIGNQIVTIILEKLLEVNGYVSVK